MSENPYEAPKSNPVVTEIVGDQKSFYVVSRRKFLALYVATFGIYGVYWFYKNWREYKNVSHEKLTPVLRGLFAIFFIHALFRKVQDALDKGGIHFPWNHRNQATALVVLSLFSSVLDKMSMKFVGSPFTDYLSLLILAPLALLLLKAQDAINMACGDEDGKTNDKFTAANIVWIVIGAAIWVLSIFGFMTSS